MAKKTLKSQTPTAPAPKILHPISHDVSFMRMHLEDQKARADGKIEYLRAHLSENPAYALEWSNDAFKAAGFITAWHQAIQPMLDMIDSNQEGRPYADHLINAIDQAQKHVMQEVIRGAQYPASSTSVPSNIVAQYTTAAWAELSETLRTWRFRFDKLIESGEYLPEPETTEPVAK